MKLAVNLSFMFLKETGSLAQRYHLAKAAGFSGVEFAFPYDIPVEELVEARRASGMIQVLINAWPGNRDAGDLGISIFPNRKDEFRSTLETSIKYLKALDCRILHIMAGKAATSADCSGFEKTYIENLRYAADRLEKEGVVAVLEAINNYTIPGYWMNHPAKALGVIKEINHPNLKLLLDVFHLQFIEGNLTNSLKTYLPFTGHIQIAQVPDRGEPDSPGEINYQYVLGLIDKMGYSGWVGLEYTPQGATTVEGLKWIKNWGYL